MSTSNPIWIDLNPGASHRYGQLLIDEDAVNVGSLQNLFLCMVGDRGRIFQPEYGSHLIEFLQEPVSYPMANMIEMSLMQTISRWEPRIRVVAITATADFSMPGYKVTILYTINMTNRPGSVTFNFPSMAG